MRLFEKVQADADGARMLVRDAIDQIRKGNGDVEIPPEVEYYTEMLDPEEFEVRTYNRDGPGFSPTLKTTVEAVCFDEVPAQCTMGVGPSQPGGAVSVEVRLVAEHRLSPLGNYCEVLQLDVRPSVETSQIARTVRVSD